VKSTLRHAVQPVIDERHVSPVRSAARFAFRNDLRTLLLGGALLFASTHAQAATVMLGDGTAVPGQGQMALPLSFQPSSGEQISVFIVNLHFDPAVAQWDSIVLEPTVIALGKQVETHVVASGHVRLVLYGLDRQALSDGALARCLMRVLTSAAPGSSVVSLRDGVGSDPNGAERPLSLFDGRIWIDAPTDTTAPTLTLTSPTDGAHFASGANVTVSGTATDDKLGVAVTVNGTAVSLGSTGAFSHSLTGLATGSHAITVDAVDAAGNHRTLTRSVTIDAPPAPEPTTSTVTMQVLSPLEGSTVSNPVSVKFEVKGVDLRSGSQYAHVHIRLDSGGVWHVYNNQPFPLGTLKPGTHTVAVMLADNVNHFIWPGTKYKKITFTVK